MSHSMSSPSSAAHNSYIGKQMTIETEYYNSSGHKTYP